MPTSTGIELNRTIPDAVIASVKANTSFLSLLRGYGMAATKKGKSLFTICPFHDIDGHPESNPSLSIDPDTNLYHCFSCNAKGNIIQFVMEKEKLTFPQAVAKLLALRGQSPKSQAAAKPVLSKVEAEDKPASAPPHLPEEERQAVLREVVKTSIETLRNNEHGRKYLEGRGLEPLTLLDHYTLGFWNGNQYPNLAESEKQKLVTIGLLNGKRSLFENCVIFPLSKDGRLTTIYGRKAGNCGTGGGHYMLACKREGLFLPNAGLNPQRPVILTESIIDGLSLFAAGVTNVLPLLGVNGFLPDHLEYLKRLAFPSIYIALNGDEAGNRAAAQLKQNLAAESLRSEILELPQGKDLNEMLLEMGAAKLKAWVDERIGNNKGDNSPPTVWEDGEEVNILIQDREYRVRGLNLFGLDRLSVNLKACRVSKRDIFYVDKFDLYQGRVREHFVAQAAKSLSAKPEEVAQDLNTIITVLEEYRMSKKRESDRPAVHEMSEAERKEALDYLRSPNLLERVAKDFESCGMVGNRDNCLLAYLGALSRLTDRPFGTLFVSRSGAGKSFLQDMVISFTPEESLLRMTRLTSQSLFYQGREGLRRKFLSIEEDEGMQEAMYSIRTLLSSQKLCLHGLKSDPKTGEYKAYENVVEGPASVMISTTDLAAFDHESVNRFFVLFFDESAQQTRRILDSQRTTAGLDKIRLRFTRERVAKLHRNIQRLLKPVMVVNRLGTGMSYPAEILNTRRENTKTEALIEAVALLHQYQREVRSERVAGLDMQYIEVTKEDLDAVHAIAGDMLRQSLDEMSKLCRELLEHIHALVSEKYQQAAKEREGLERWQVTFTRKELKDRCRWSRWHLEEHLRELEEAGYITQRIGKKGQRYAYALVEDTIPELPHVNKSI